MSKFSVILVLMFSYPFILFMMRIQELRESRGIVIKLFYHTLALLFCFISQTLPSGWVENMLFLPHFKF